MIVLPFPSSKLSGQNNAHHWVTRPITNQHRQWAVLATLEAKPVVPTDGDIRLHIHFVPPDRRGDRCNFWNRCKPYIDGIAEALGINDSRFLPSKSFGSPEKQGRVEVTIGERSGENYSPFDSSDALKEKGPSACGNTMLGPDHETLSRSAP